MEWQLQDAKARLSELVATARREGPQTVTLRGQRAAVVLSAEDYDRLTEGAPNLVSALLEGPDWPDDFAAAVENRPRDLPRATQI